jgi:hypothetical protein
VANNTGSTSNSSTGAGLIQTGDATATGNASNTTIDQQATCNASGGLGGVCIVNQTAGLSNSGTATADTGNNTAVGNASSNQARTTQDPNGSIVNNTADTSNSSDGTAAVSTGDANSTGNSANNDVHQSVDGTVGGSLGGVLIVNQSATVSNRGTADANTGNNAAVGNASTNQATTVQGAVSGAGPPGTQSVANNDGQSTNTSDGTAGIATGNATAVGNASNTNITQSVNVTNAGKLGGVALVNQDADVTNAGTATANTGGNVAVGNASTNSADTGQFAVAPLTGRPQDSVAANFGSSTNSSDGTAGIITGNATAVGNASSTHISQVANVTTTGLVLTNQDADVVNRGTATANSGGNVAVGNISTNNATTNQFAASGPAKGDTVAANFGEATNQSDGTAGIITGDATAVGSLSSTEITQEANSDPSFALVNQDADVTNRGRATANSGLNLAVGNASSNRAVTNQAALTGVVLRPRADDTVASNFGDSGNTSDGTAVVVTGNAAAAGNVSATDIAQQANVDPAFAIVDQSASVRNTGRATANSGRNVAVGNVSTNRARTNQIAVSGPATSDTVAANFGTAHNTSDGTAVIVTGDATAAGNVSTTGIAQVADPTVTGSGFALVDQDVDVVNRGRANANSGRNLAVGNVSTNRARTNQAAVALGAGGDSIATNDGQATNDSDGTAVVVTGCASAAGNVSETNVGQMAVPTVGRSGFAIVDQDVDVVNRGRANANSGRNVAVGNASFNRANTNQAAVALDLTGRPRDVVASNTADTANTSDGTALIVTGCACAIGNSSLTDIGQLANVDGGRRGFAIVGQDADVVNRGRASANSGRNVAVGNASFNRANTNQLAVALDLTGRRGTGEVVANNTADTANASDGTAAIITGCATAIGNQSTTDIGQLANVEGGRRGFAIVGQDADVVNRGQARANSGRNLAVGNASFNRANTNQLAVALDLTGRRGTGDVVANNTAGTVNASDGTAVIVTGDAGALGNHSETNVGQMADVDPSGSGFTFINQDTDVVNRGRATANSGRNVAVGNLSFNRARTNQLAVALGLAPGTTGDVVANNTGGTLNASDGTAVIATGSATAYGNVSETNVGQVDPGFAFVNQSVDVVNRGRATANSGRNLAVGNVSFNRARTNQLAIALGLAGPGDVVANNTGASVNQSNGLAAVLTGSALAAGNVSATNALQVVDTTGNNGFVFANQAITVVNRGRAHANTGRNAAFGNLSFNRARTNQLAFALSGVANNTAGTVNNSDGTALIATGNASAFGNVAATSACQFLNTGGSCPVAVLPPLPELPSCPCHAKPPVPPVTPPPAGPTPPEVVTIAKVAPAPVAEVPALGVGGGQLAFTGASLLAQLLLGLALLALGALLVRKAPAKG